MRTGGMGNNNCEKSLSKINVVANDPVPAYLIVTGTGNPGLATTSPWNNGKGGVIAN